MDRERESVCQLLAVKNSCITSVFYLLSWIVILIQLEYQRQQLLLERQQFHQEMLKQFDMRAMHMARQQIGPPPTLGGGEIGEYHRACMLKSPVASIFHIHILCPHRNTESSTATSRSNGPHCYSHSQSAGYQ